MTRKIIQLLLLYFIGAFLIGCQTTSGGVVLQYLSEKNICSFLDIFPVLAESAQDQSSDAQLSSVDIDLAQPNNIIAVFSSPRRKDIDLIVRYNANEGITTNLINYTYPGATERNQNLIDISEVAIDSPDAWFIFIHNINMNQYDLEDFDCATLLLLTDAAGSPYWRLSVGDCQSQEHHYYHIDAKTGKWLTIDFP